MENFYGFYELGYIEYYWYLLFSLYYKFLEFPVMIRVCSVILTLLVLIIPISIIVLFVRNQLVTARRRRYLRKRRKYIDVFKEILTCPEPLSEDVVREKIIEARGVMHGNTKFKKKELDAFVQILMEKVQEYNRKNINRDNYQMVLNVLNIAAWLEDIIEKKGVKQCIKAFNTAQILDCPLRGSVSARFAYHKNEHLRKAARTTYMFTNRDDPFRYVEGEDDFNFEDVDAPAFHDILVYRNDNEYVMPNFINWLRLEQADNKLKLFAISEILFLKKTECCDELYEFMKHTTDMKVKGMAMRALGKLGHTEMEDYIRSMYKGAQSFLRISILSALRDLGLRGEEYVNFFKTAYEKSEREKESMTALDALYNCGEEGKAAFLALQSAAGETEKMRFAHIMNPITNDRAYER